MRPLGATRAKEGRMKTTLLLFILSAASLLSGCSVRGHANSSSTGAGISTPVGSAGAGVHY